jgi:cohesin loading factor subunit SCC2
MIKPISGRREEYTRYDVVETSDTLSQQRRDEHHTALKPHEREIADRKIEEVRSLITTLSEDKDEPEPEHFMAVSTPDGDFTVMKPKAMDKLHDKMGALINLGRFAVLPVSLVMEAQSLLQPGVISVTKNGSFTQEDDTLEWSDNIQAAKVALKASRMILDTMIEGHDDHRMRRQEIIDMMIDLIKFIKDACLVPVLQARRSGSAEDLFNAATGQKKELQAVLRLCGSVVSRFALLINKYKLSDRALNGLEYIALELVMEQNSESEKDSIFTIQKFEQFRQRAVDVLAEIFARHAEQQDSILNGVLSNLEKLPAKKASARHFKSAREVPIMTISALFMRFVQVAATNKEERSKAASGLDGEASDGEASDYEPGTSVKKAKKRKGGPGQIAEMLSLKASHIARRIASSLIDRASNVSKTGDKPFRNLLDLFVEDFCNVLGSPEWPAAEMLLENMSLGMLNILRVDPSAKHTVVDKDMALTTLSTIASCGILDLKTRLKKLKREKLDVSESDISSKLDRYIDDVMNDDAREGFNNLDLLAFDGPYRMIVESLPDYLEVSSSHDDDPRLRSVRGCYVTLWLAAVTRAFPADADDSESYPLAARDVHKHLGSMITDSTWLAQKYKFPSVSDVQSKIAAGIVTLQSSLCRQHLPTIIARMLERMQDKNSSKLRSRGMTGLEQLIQKDPKVINKKHFDEIIRSFSDSSPMVRESTLNTVSTLFEHQPSLQAQALQPILQIAAHDASNGPKKKAIKLLRDIYHGPSSMEQKLTIIAHLLSPSQDDDKAVSELALSVLEEVLLAPGKTGTRVDENRLKLDRTQRSSLVVNTVQRIFTLPKQVEAFENFLLHALSPGGKENNVNMRTCKTLVADLFDEVISPDTGSDTRLQARIMTTLSVFAKVWPTLFTLDQTHLLKVYIKKATCAEDLDLVRPVVIILRYVFPTLNFLQAAFAEEVRASLFSNVSPLAKWACQTPKLHPVLVDVAHCLWTLTLMSTDGAPKLCALITSILCQLRPYTSDTQVDVTTRSRIQSWLILLGIFGKVCDFEKYTDLFRARLKAQVDNHIAKNPATAEKLGLYLKGDLSASRILLETVRPFTMQAWDQNIRVQALQSVGEICQSSPDLFMRAEIHKIYSLVFINGDNHQLLRIALDAFNDYFTFAERRSETGATTGNERMDASYQPTADDSAVTSLARLFLPYILDLALKRDDELAVLSTYIVASISRQGLGHPRMFYSSLVALTTSDKKEIALTATAEQQRLNQKETHVDTEYMQAVRKAFDYQVGVFDDPHGMRESSYSAKLVRMFEAVKNGKKPAFKKFIHDISKQADFNFAQLDSSGDIPTPVLFARFCLENVALLDFALLEEVAICLIALQAMVLKNTGPSVALAIDTEMPKPLSITQQPPVPDEASLSVQPTGPTVDDARLRQLATACMILRMTWETRCFIRRAYNLHKLKGGIPQKDYVKPAQRNNFVSGKELWDSFMPIMNALDSRESMVKICYDLADIVNVDQEVEFDAEGYDVEFGGGYDTPTGEDETVAVPTSGRGRKRKSNVSLGNTPKKVRGRPAGMKIKKRNSKTPDFDDDSD